MSSAADSAPGLLQRVLAAVTGPPAALVQFFVGGRGLGALFLLVVLALSLRAWITVPINTDIGALALPLWGSAMSVEQATRLLYGPRAFAPLGVGTLLLVAGGIGLLLALLVPRRLVHGFGLLTVAVLASIAAASLNHPLLIEEMDRQDQFRSYLINTMTELVDPYQPLTSRPRVETTPISAPRGSFIRGSLYLPKDRYLCLLLCVVGMVYAAHGPVYRRLLLAAGWCVLGAVCAGAVVAPRALAEARWNDALLADAEGRPDDATRLIDGAEQLCPALRDMQRTWSLRGKIDFRRGLDTPAARYFQGEQWQHSGETRHTLEDLEDLASQDLPSPHSKRWLSDFYVAAGFQHFDLGFREAARQAWRRACELDPSQKYLVLFDAALRAPQERIAPDEVAQVVEPLLEGMLDNTLRCSLQSMLADMYFENGQFVRARELYEASLESYQLPKQINYRGMRGLVGM